MLTPWETKGWAEAKKAGVDGADYRMLRTQIRNVEPTKDREGNIIVPAAQKQREILMGWSNLTPEQKKLIDKYLIAGEDQPPADYTSEALMKLSSTSKTDYQDALGMRNNGITPEKYLEYVELRDEYKKAAADAIKSETQRNYFSELGGTKYDTVTPESVNDRLHTAIWMDEELSESQRYKLEAKVTGTATWTDKAAKAAMARISTDKFYQFASKTRDYDGENPSLLTWQTVRKDKSLSAQQQIIARDLLSDSDSQKRVEELMAGGVSREPATRHYASYLDYKLRDEENPLGYSDELTVKVEIARDGNMTMDEKINLTVGMFGNDLAEKIAKAQQAGISRSTYYRFWIKYYTTDGKDANGNSISGLLKQVYRIHAPDLDDYISREEAEKMHKRRIDEMQTGGWFQNPVSRIYRWNDEYDTERYLKLMNSYSDFHAIDAGTRAAIRKQTTELIDRDGGKIVIPQEVRLYMAKKL